MKKFNLVLVLIIGALVVPTGSDAQVVEEGDIVVDVNYGWPNMLTIIMKNAYISGSEQNVEVKNVGPVGIRGEIFVSDHVAIGLEINYSNTVVSYEDQEGNSGSEVVVHSYEISVPRFRVMPKVSYHFVESEQIDFYSSGAIGFLSTQYKFDSTDDTFNEDEVGLILPIAFRLAVGMKYFFTENIGLNLEAGIGGGGILVGGLSVKL